MEYDIHEIDKVLEAAVLLRSSEEGYARDYRAGSAFGREQDWLRLDAFTLGVLDALARTLGKHPRTLALLVYLKKLLDHGPGATARDAAAKMLSLGDLPELTRYVAGGRRIVLRQMAGQIVQPGLFAQLLEEELR
jgi:phytoene dehydrogenase-like protein